MKTKKGDGHLYSILIVVFTFIVLLTAAFLFQSKFQAISPVPIGDKQFALYDIYQAAEDVLFFVDEVSRYSIFQAIYDVSSRGGYFASIGEDFSTNTPDSPCGTYLGYAMWNSEDAECLPYDVTSNIEEEINSNLDRYLDYYTTADIPNNNYRIGIVGDVVYGKATKKLHFSQRLDIGLSEMTLAQEREALGNCNVPVLVELEGECLQTTETSCKATPALAEQFKKAQGIANKKGVELSITSAYRSFASQKELWESSGRDTSRVAKPSCNAPHVLGKAVDVVIKGGDGMGSTSMSDMSIGDRRMLEEIMLEAGFVRYVKEFWHYEYGTKRWAG